MSRPRPAGRGRRLAARGRPGRRAARGARLRPGAPGPQARQRAAGRRRAARDRLRHLPRVRGHPADLGRDGGRDPRLHVTRAGRGQPGGPAERRLLARLRARLRGDRQRAVRRRQRRLHPLPGGHRRARPERHPGRPAAGHHRLPGQGPGPADRAGAAHRHGRGPRAAAAGHDRRLLARAAGRASSPPTRPRTRPPRWAAGRSARPRAARSGSAGRAWRTGLGGPGIGGPGLGDAALGGPGPGGRTWAGSPVQAGQQQGNQGVAPARHRARADGARRLLRGGRRRHGRGPGLARPGAGVAAVRPARGRAVVAAAVDQQYDVRPAVRVRPAVPGTGQQPAAWPQERRRGRRRARFPRRRPCRRRPGRRPGRDRSTERRRGRSRPGPPGRGRARGHAAGAVVAAAAAVVRRFLARRRPAERTRRGELPQRRNPAGPVRAGTTPPDQGRAADAGARRGPADVPGRGRHRAQHPLRQPWSRAATPHGDQIRQRRGRYRAKAASLRSRGWASARPRWPPPTPPTAAARHANAMAGEIGLVVGLGGLIGVVCWLVVAARLPPRPGLDPDGRHPAARPRHRRAADRPARHPQRPRRCRPPRSSSGSSASRRPSCCGGARPATSSPTTAASARRWRATCRLRNPPRCLLVDCAIDMLRQAAHARPRR